MDTSNKNEKPKVVTTLDINLPMPSMKSREWIDESVDEHLHCVLCGGDLKFSHKTDFVEQTVVEHAVCPICQVKTRESVYGLQ
ncbi:MAG: hypothetical protein AB7F86_02005 [Bdellovibrionales bacterium]